MISIVSYVLAIICNAIMDTLADKPHFENSIFHKLDPEFWLKTDSWDNKYVDTDGDGEGEPEAGFVFKTFKILNNFLDAWHIFQGCMIGFIVVAIVSYEPLITNIENVPNVFVSEELNLYLTQRTIDFWVYGISWIVVFNPFYNKILKKRSKNSDGK